MTDYNAKYPLFDVEFLTPEIAHVQFNQPRIHNAFNDATWRQYAQVFTELDAEPKIKAIIVSGKGKNFTAGLNLRDGLDVMVRHIQGKGQPAADGLHRNLEMYRYVLEFQECIGTTANISTPVIAVAHGHCIGLGLDILGTTLIRVASADTNFSIREIHIGIVADIGSLQRLPALVNNKLKLHELALTARDFDAAEALDLGLVLKVLPDKEAALAHAVSIAKEIATKERWTVRVTREELRYMVEGGNVEEGLRRVARAQTNGMGPATAARMASIMKGKL